MVVFAVDIEPLHDGLRGGNPEAVELLQLSDVAVESDHAVGVEPKPSHAPRPGDRCFHTCIRVRLK